MAGELVERPVVGGGVKPPEPGAAGVGESRGELVAEQSEEPEDDVGIAGGVGHDLAGTHAGLRVKQPVEQVQRVGLGAGHDHGVDRDVVIGGRGQGGDAAAAVVVAAVEAGVDGAVGDHEPQPVDRGDLAAAPAGRELEPGVVVDDPGVGGDQRLGADVVAGDVFQSRFAQRGNALVDQRLVADVAGLRDEHGADADVQVREAGVGLVLVGEAVEEPCLGRDLQQQVGQVGVG